MLREEFDCEIVATNLRYVDAEHDFIAGEIDFEWIDPDTGLVENGEVKTVSPFAFGELHGWGEAGTDEVPVHYAAQAMHNLGIMRRRICVLVAMVGLDTMVFYRINRDDATITEMRVRAVDFWHNHVLARVPPDPISLADVMRLTLNMRARLVEADDALAKMIEDLNAIRGRIKAREGEKDDLDVQDRPRDLQGMEHRRRGHRSRHRQRGDHARRQTDCELESAGDHAPYSKKIKDADPAIFEKIF